MSQVNGGNCVVKVLRPTSLRNTIGTDWDRLDPDLDPGKVEILGLFGEWVQTHIFTL